MHQILIVEDDPALSQGIRLALGQEGRQFVQAGTIGQAERELAEDTDADERGQRRETGTLGRGSGTQDVVVTRERYPSYQGAVVVCEGAGDAAVRLALTEAVSALTGLSADRISIVQWKS